MKVGLTLEQLGQELVCQSEVKQDYLVSSDKMMMETTESAFGESETVQISDDFVCNAATSLGVPMNSEYSYSMSDAWYASEFDAYVVPIEFMHNGQTIASADCDLEGHPVRNINPNRAES